MIFFFSRESRHLTSVHSLTLSVIYKAVASRTGTQRWIRHSLCLPQAQAMQRTRVESQVLDLCEPPQALTLPYLHRQSAGRGEEDWYAVSPPSLVATSHANNYMSPKPVRALMRIQMRRWSAGVEQNNQKISHRSDALEHFKGVDK